MEGPAPHPVSAGWWGPACAAQSVLRGWGAQQALLGHAAPQEAAETVVHIFPHYKVTQIR